MESTVDLLALHPSAEIRVVDIAKRANVGIPTIYYHFSSREVLISEAQVESFRQLMASRHEHMGEMREAIDGRDQAQFTEAFHRYHLNNASAATIEAMWDFVRVLADIRTDHAARHRFVEIHDTELEERVTIVSDAQRLGWLNADIDARAYVAHSGTAVLGRILLEGSEHFSIDPEVMHQMMWGWIGPRDGATER